MEQRIRQCLSDVFDAEVAGLARLENLGGHASLRIYWRIHLPEELPRVYPRGELTLMAMVLPQDSTALASDEAGSSGADVPEELPFVNVHRYLVEIGMPVPAIDLVDMERGVLLLEDLGPEMFENAVLAAADTSAVESLYEEAIELLIKFQKATAAGTHDDLESECIAWRRAFDGEVLRWELDHYLEWGLEAQLGKEVVAPFRARFDVEFDRIVAGLLEAEQVLVLRDYQSRNIMRKQGTWILIDFQDALVGPCVYDLVALLRDSYIELAPATVARLLDYYIARGAQAGLAWCGDAAGVRRAFHMQTLQRKLKDAGRFIFIDRVKENPAFLDYYEPSIAYVANALEQLPEFETLRALLAEVEPAWPTNTPDQDS